MPHRFMALDVDGAGMKSVRSTPSTKILLHTLRIQTVCVRSNRDMP